MCVWHGHNCETSERPGETTCVALDARDGQLPNFASRWYITSCLLARYTHTQGYIKDTPLLR